jgi:tetratricopeptide (TPR) repeat protein
MQRARLTLTLERELRQDPRRQAMIHALIASICLPAGLFTDALEHAQLAVGAGTSPTVTATHTVILADVHLARAETDLAAQRYTGAAEIFSSVGHRAGQAKCGTGLGAVAIERGLYTQAAAHLDKALTLARQAGDEGTHAEASLQFGRLLLCTGKASDALGHLHRARQLGTVPTVRIAALIERSRALRNLGRHTEAAQAAQEAVQEASGSEYAPMIAAAEQALSAALTDH